MDHTIKMFLKFGEHQYMRDLLENGTIYMNTVEWFRKKENDELRGDSYEGATRVINSLPGTFNLPGIERDFRYEKVHLKESYEKIYGNIYSLYCVSSFGFPNPLYFKIDEKMLDFGSYCVMIKDNQYFFDKLQNELRNQGYNFNHGFVEYYDKETANKRLSVFEKPNEFEYQKEFRFFVENQKMEPVVIKLGDLSNYAELVRTEEVIEGLNLEVG